MIERPGHLARLRNLLEQFPVFGLIGARQVGKTTLAKAYAARFEGEVTRFDLENPRDLYRLEDPMFGRGNLRRGFRRCRRSATASGSSPSR